MKALGRETERLQYNGLTWDQWSTKMLRQVARELRELMTKAAVPSAVSQGYVADVVNNTWKGNTPIPELLSVSIPEVMGCMVSNTRRKDREQRKLLDLTSVLHLYITWYVDRQRSPIDGDQLPVGCADVA